MSLCFAWHLRTSKEQIQSWLIITYSCTPFSSLWTAEMEIWKVNYYFYAFKNKAHRGNNFWGIGNRQKVSEGMHWSPSCFKFFETLSRCPYPYITEWNKARSCILDSKSLADTLYFMQCFNIHLDIPPRNVSECCSLRVHTRFSLFCLSLLCLFFKKLHENWEWSSKCVFSFICLPPSPEVIPSSFRGDSNWKKWEDRNSANIFRRGIGLTSIGNGMRIKQNRAVQNLRP